MTLPSRQLFWIANSTKRRAGSHLVRASAARFAAGRPAKRTNGFAPADMIGTRSKREESAQRAFTSGLKRNASRAADGQRIRIGMRSDALTSGNRRHTAAKAETTGYARAYRRVFDSQPQDHLPSAVCRPARRRCALATRFRQ